MFGLLPGSGRPPRSPRLDESQSLQTQIAEPLKRQAAVLGAVEIDRAVRALEEPGKRQVVAGALRVEAAAVSKIEQAHPFSSGKLGSAVR